MRPDFGLPVIHLSSDGPLERDFFLSPLWPASMAGMAGPSGALDKWQPENMISQSLPLHSGHSSAWHLLHKLICDLGHSRLKGSTMQSWYFSVVNTSSLCQVYLFSVLYHACRDCFAHQTSKVKRQETALSSLVIYDLQVLRPRLGQGRIQDFSRVSTECWAGIIRPFDTLHFIYPYNGRIMPGNPGKGIRDNWTRAVSEQV